MNASDQTLTPSAWTKSVECYICTSLIQLKYTKGQAKAKIEVI